MALMHKSRHVQIAYKITTVRYMANIPVDELPPFINLQILPHGFLPAAVGLVLVNS